MKYSLLDLTQAVLSSMDGDEINSINDSTESQQVVKVIRTVYYDLINRANLPEHYSLVNLTASGDNAKPVIMYVPTTVDKIKWVKYDNATATSTALNMEYVEFLCVEDFLDKMHSLDTTATNVKTFTYTDSNGNVFTVVYVNDKAPQWYTSFDDKTLIFDSYDHSVDTTLQSHKSLCRGRNIIPFTESDTFVPNLDEPQFALLLNEAKSLAWAELRQTANPKAEQGAKRGWTSLQKTKFATQTLSDFNKLPYYGRK